MIRPGTTPNTEDVETLLAVAAAGDFTQAARFLGVTQPIITRRIARLERLVGGQLVTRGCRAKSAKLTSHGEAYVEAVRPIVDALIGVCDKLRADNRENHGQQREAQGAEAGTSNGVSQRGAPQGCA